MSSYATCPTMYQADAAALFETPVARRETGVPCSSKQLRRKHVAEQKLHDNQQQAAKQEQQEQLRQQQQQLVMAGQPWGAPLQPLPVDLAALHQALQHPLFAAGFFECQRLMVSFAPGL